MSLIFFDLLGWFIGGVNENCDTSCHKHNLICSEEDMWKHPNNVRKHTAKNANAKQYERQGYEEPQTKGVSQAWRLLQSTKKMG